MARPVHLLCLKLCENNMMNYWTVCCS